MQNIIHNLQTGGKPFNENIEKFFQRNLNLKLTDKFGLSRMNRSGAIKTHLPMDRLSFNGQAKSILCLYFFLFVVQHVG